MLLQLYFQVEIDVAVEAKAHGAIGYREFQHIWVEFLCTYL